MADLRFSKVKKVLILKAEDTAQLRWAHVASCGEERKATSMSRYPQAVTLRCPEIDKEMAILGKFLEEGRSLDSAASMDGVMGTFLRRKLGGRDIDCLCPGPLSSYLTV